VSLGARSRVADFRFLDLGFWIAWTVSTSGRWSRTGPFAGASVGGAGKRQPSV